MRILVVVVVLQAVASVTVALTPNCDIMETCSQCIRSPTCVWCEKADFSLSRCISKDSPSYAEFEEQCGKTKVNDPQNIKTTINEGNPNDQLRPQRVKLAQRPGETQTFQLTYTHMANYPVDLYYLMDLSLSMRDDKEMLANLGHDLVSGMQEITSNFMIGFGAFSDKTVLPFIETVDWSELEKACPADSTCSKPFSFRSFLPLTTNSNEFNSIVNEANTTINVDYPEGSFDGLMQVLACEDEIKWRKLSLKIIVITTDAPFHIAGDGSLGGIMTPNDMSCHLNKDGFYTEDKVQDYPSVGQIHKMVEDKNTTLIFAVAEAQEPLYARLSQLLPRTSYSILLEDSSNIVKLLVDKVQEISSSMTLKYESDIRLTDEIRVDISSPQCNPTCTNLQPDDTVQFTVSVSVIKCPEDPSLWNTVISIHPDGRTETITIDLSLICQCNCTHQGVIYGAKECSYNGDLVCGICHCYDGHLGQQCQCEASDITGDGTIDESSCKSSNTSDKICSGRGTCICGQCECDTLDGDKEITGKFCQCTNYLNCDSGDGQKCSGHGKCNCNKCDCYEGYSGQRCQCDKGNNKCLNPDTNEVCSGHGNCSCNTCNCTSPYTGRYCDDCPQGVENCIGKCEEYKDCVECLAFGTGPLKSTCDEQCRGILVEKMDKIDESSAKYCSATDENGCRFYFTHEGRDPVQVQVQEKVECPQKVDPLYVILGVLGAVVLIGLLALILWRVLATLRDRREYMKFQKESAMAQGSSTVTSPIFRPAITTTQNPVYGAN